MLVSFSTNLLNFLWHGLNYPDSLPARQSFLYIFLLLSLCYEALIHLHEHSKSEIIALFLGVLFFVLLCEKLITDDSFTGMTFLSTGFFLLIYAMFIYHWRLQSDIPKWLSICVLVVVIVESGVNTYLTSVPTVSRTTYLSNHDSYQILTDRTVQKENSDFFRFEKFARRTQNDAMLIGFQGASYFSSTLNSLVSDFYEKYGMRGSRVNYCFEGATPVTAALLSNRYMLYTLDRGYDNMFELVDTEGKLYLYQNNYSLPLGYMITENDAFTPNLNELFRAAKHTEENIHEEDNEDKNLNPIQRQNNLVHDLGLKEDMFIEVDTNSYGSQADIYIEETAHYYAYSTNTKIDTIKLNYEEESKSFSQIKKKYILDLGYHEAGDVLSLKSENGEKLNLTTYKINESALTELVKELNRQTMTVNQYDETSITGHIDVSSAGHLVLSVPFEPSWTLYVDGVKTEMDLFEKTFISVYLDEGSHTITLRYFPDGFIPGTIISVFCVLLFIALFFVQRFLKQSSK